MKRFRLLAFLALVASATVAFNTGVFAGEGCETNEGSTCTYTDDSCPGTSGFCDEAEEVCEYYCENIYHTFLLFTDCFSYEPGACEAECNCFPIG